MEVKIDYDYEIIQDEKLRIKWIIDEFDAQFGDRIRLLTDEDITCGLEFLDYIISSVETENPEIITFLRCNLERLEKRFPVFFN
ncbi:MAG: hypothetical protein ACTSRD_07435 [Promethearchaeota archaeon]